MALFEKLRAEGRGMIGFARTSAASTSWPAPLPCAACRPTAWPTTPPIPELFEELNAQRRRWGVEVIPWRNLRGLHGAARERRSWASSSTGATARGRAGEAVRGVDDAARGAGDARGRDERSIVPVVCRRFATGPTKPGTTIRSRWRRHPARDRQCATQLVADSIEDMIAAAPDQWYSFKPIWPQTQAESQALEKRHAQMLGGGSGRRAAKA